MELIDDRTYFEPPERGTKTALKCYFCEETIYENEEYYALDGFSCCKKCLDIHFKFIAKPPDY